MPLTLPIEDEAPLQWINPKIRPMDDHWGASPEHQAQIEAVTLRATDMPLARLKRMVFPGLLQLICSMKFASEEMCVFGAG